jgi:7-carboxy-7-deazaguanine synthase
MDGSRNICFTGGEPFLQRHSDLIALVEELSYQGFRFEVFTNGTFLIPASMLDMSVAPVLDWKLPGSGETSANPNRIRNVETMKGRHLGSIKFTVADRDDFEMARALWTDFLQDGTLEVFVGPVWGKVAPQQVVDWIRFYRLPWRLNIQAHNYIFGVNVRGT